MEISINNQKFSVDVDSDMPLLWMLRDHLGLTGTKYGCGIGICGSCVVLMDGHAVRSCKTTVSMAAGKSIMTIEGLSSDNSHLLQQAWEELQVPQCGYCQSGQILTAFNLLQTMSHDLEDGVFPTDDQIDVAMSGVLCRCGTYPRIREAIKLASQKMNKKL